MVEQYVNSIEYKKISVEEKELKEKIPFYESLYDFQKAGIKFAIENQGKALIADEMGLGKTIQAIGIISYYKEKTLVITTSTLLVQWKNELMKWLSMNDEIVVQKDCFTEPSKNGITLMSYGLFVSKHIDQFLDKHKFQLIVMDESHKLKTRTSVRTKHILKLTKKANHVIGLSGTPMNRPSDLYAQIRCIDYSLFPGPFSKHFLDLKGLTYGSRYCGPKLIYIRGKSIVDYSGSSNLDELHRFLTKTIMIRRTKEQILMQLPEKYREYVVIGEVEDKKLPDAGSMEKHEFMSLIRENASLKIPFVLNYLKEYEEDLDEDTNRPQKLIFCHHHSMSDAIKEKFPSYVVVDGRTSLVQKAKIIEDFQNSKINTLVLGIESVGCGVTLTKGNLVMFTELAFNPDIHAQAEDRIHRIGQQNECFIRYLILKGYTDDVCMRILQKKTKWSGLVLENTDKKITFGKKKKIDHQDEQKDS